jgi:hypothetical protein
MMMMMMMICNLWTVVWKFSFSTYKIKVDVPAIEQLQVGRNGLGLSYK